MLRFVLSLLLALSLGALGCGDGRRVGRLRRYRRPRRSRWRDRLRAGTDLHCVLRKGGWGVRRLVRRRGLRRRRRRLVPAGLRRKLGLSREPSPKPAGTPWRPCSDARPSSTARASTTGFNAYPPMPIRACPRWRPSARCALRTAKKIETGRTQRGHPVSS